MKNLALVFLALVFVSSLAFAGDVAKSGEWGIQTSLGVASTSGLAFPGFQTLGAKYMLNDNWALRGEVGFASYSPANDSLTKGTGFGIGAGVEDHMSAVGNVSPYWGVQFGYGTVSPSIATSAPSGSNPATVNVKAVLGGEYFFSSNFSMGGECGIGYWMINNQFYNDGSGNGLQSGSSKLISTSSLTLILSWYLN